MSFGHPRVGVLGGGQLGRMLGISAASMQVPMSILDPAETPPASIVAHHQQGPFDDYAQVLAFSETVDALTIEIEHVSTEAMRTAQVRGCNVFPSADVVETVQDKLKQKNTLVRAGIPTPQFRELPPEPEFAAETIGSFGVPVVVKSRYGGYDGRGVAVLHRLQDIALSGLMPAFVEQYVDRAAELSVLVARSEDGSTVVYPPFQITVHDKLNLVESVWYPSDVTVEAEYQAVEMARSVAEALDVVGILAVELFVARSGAVLVNEVAPRPHNSGHLTIEAAETSQFEQHLRAGLGLPLGSVTMRNAAVMRNIVGEGEAGPSVVGGIKRALALPGVHVHLYGKSQSRPGRKMGHLTVCAGTLPEAHHIATQAANEITVKGGKPEW